jgi:ADP-heptose:LPS heptosyltransferase
MLSYKNKIFIDRTFGFITAVVMRFLTRLVGIILRRDHTLPENPKILAVAKIVGLGSIVYTGILCRSIKESFPKTKLIYITSKGSIELVKRMNYIDEILLIDDKGFIPMITSTIFLILRLWRLRPILYFDMEIYSSWAAIIATLSLALNRYGFYRKNADFKKGMHTHMIFFNTKRHISEIYSQMALCVGGKPNPNLIGILNVSSQDKALCVQTLKEIGLNDNLIILVNVNASDLLIERRWPAEKWIDYLEQIVQQLPDYSFLLTGSPNEHEYVSALYNKLSQSARNKVFNIAGRFTFAAFLSLIEKCVLMVTNDSGPLHFAVALNKPTISIWGPGAPEHYAPIRGFYKIIYEPVYCSPCLYHADIPPCEGNNVCVKDISVFSVLEATKEIIADIELHRGEHLKNEEETTFIKTKAFTPVIIHKNIKNR